MHGVVGLGILDREVFRMGLELYNLRYGYTVRVSLPVMIGEIGVGVLWRTGD